MQVPDPSQQHKVMVRWERLMFMHHGACHQMSAQSRQVWHPLEHVPLDQVEAVENHMPEIVIVDEIGTEAEALACRTIAERGVQLIATAHGQLLENLLKNPTLSDLVGGIQSVTLGENLDTLNSPVVFISVTGSPTRNTCGSQVMRRQGLGVHRRVCWNARHHQLSRLSLRCVSELTGSRIGWKTPWIACCMARFQLCR